MKLKFFLLTSTLLAMQLPQIKAQQESKQNDEVLLWIDGKPALTVKDLKKYGIRGPQDYSYDILIELLLIPKWIKKKGFDEIAEYKNLENEVNKSPESFIPSDRYSQLAKANNVNLTDIVFFEKRFPFFQVSTNEIKDFYEKATKELGIYGFIPLNRLLGSNNIIGIRFKDQENKKEILNKYDNIDLEDAKMNPDEFKKLFKKIADENNLVFQEFKNVTGDNISLPKFIRLAVLHMLWMGDNNIGYILEEQPDQKWFWVLKLLDSKKIRNTLPSFEEFFNDRKFDIATEAIIETIRYNKIYIDRNRKQAIDQLKKELNVKENFEVLEQLKKEKVQ